MAIVERPTNAILTYAGADTAVTATSSYGYLRRPVETTGWRSWAFTVDHKKIGIMYGVTAMIFFIIGGMVNHAVAYAARQVKPMWPKLITPELPMNT